VPTGIPESDIGELSPSYQMQYENSDSSDCKIMSILIYIVDTTENWIEDAAFYDKFDEQIYKFVAHVTNLIDSVATEREILSKIILSFTLFVVTSILF